jgi:hypothetical protein
MKSPWPTREARNRSPWPTREASEHDCCNKEN